MRGKEIEVFSGDEDDICGTLKDVIEMLQKTLDEVPDEFKEAVEIEVKADSCAYANVQISYLRPPTEDELTKKADKERDQIKRNINYHEEGLEKERKKLLEMKNEK
mgnify:FL=1